jgi:hypothetical protein
MRTSKAPATFFAMRPTRCRIQCLSTVVRWRRGSEVIHGKPDDDVSCESERGEQADDGDRGSQREVAAGELIGEMP